MQEVENERIRSEFSQIKLRLQASMPGVKPDDFVQFRLAGTNQNGSMGIGLHNEASRNRIYTLDEFRNKKIHAFAVGDYHSVLIASGCNCVDSIEGTARGCKGITQCNGGADVYSWGLNSHA